jgi:hypothetical protein
MEQVGFAEGLAKQFTEPDCLAGIEVRCRDLSQPFLAARRKKPGGLNVEGCSIGRSAGWAPRRILSTKVAARRYCSGIFVP